MKLSGQQFHSLVNRAESMAYRSITKLCSLAAIDAFSRRESVPIGRSKECSAMHGSRVVLLGDAGALFPPVGQGVNAAMEAATVLDTCIGLQLGNGRLQPKTSLEHGHPRQQLSTPSLMDSNIKQMCSSSQDPFSTYALESVHCTMRKMEICRTYMLLPSNVTLIAA